MMHDRAIKLAQAVMGYTGCTAAEAKEEDLTTMCALAAEIMEGVPEEAEAIEMVTETAKEIRAASKDENHMKICANPITLRRWADVLEAAERRVEELTSAIRKHRDQKGDDRCWLDDLDLYSTMDDASYDSQLPPKCEFLESCSRYWNQRQTMMDKSADRPTIKQLENRIAELEAQIAKPKVEVDWDAMGEALFAAYWANPNCDWDASSEILRGRCLRGAKAVIAAYEAHRPREKISEADVERVTRAIYAEREQYVMGGLSFDQLSHSGQDIYRGKARAAIKAYLQRPSTEGKTDD
jgi:hypothetical protein